MTILLILCVAAAVAGLFLRRKDSQKSPLLIIIPAVLAIIIVIIQSFSAPTREAQKKRVAKEVEKTFLFDYALGWQLSQQAAKQNPNAQAVALVMKWATTDPKTSQGQWLAAAQEVAKINGLKLAVEPLTIADLVPTKGQITADALQRIHQAQPNASVWLSCYVPQTNALDQLDFLAPDKVRFYGYAGVPGELGQKAKWWSAQLQSGRLAAIAIARSDDPHVGHDLTDNPETNFKVAYVLVTSESPQLPQEIIDRMQ